MRVILSIVLMVNILFGASISLEDMQKYQQYKSMLDNGAGGSSTQKVVKQDVIKNNIEQNSMDQNMIDNTMETKESVDQNSTEEYNNIFKYDQKDKPLKRYGENFFKNKNQLNSALVPTSNNYILHSGDTLFINSYDSKRNDTLELTIDNNGDINLPNLGLLKVGGLKLDEARAIIKNKIVKSKPKTKVIVDISGYSSIQVIITGNVEVPGIYNLSSFSTVKDALMVAGGLLDVGSYRDIDIVRGGKKIYNFDLYKLLNDTNGINDIILQSGDIVSVNFIKKTIYLSGKVKYPAIYELKNGETYKDLLRYSGGFRYDATKDSIKITRYSNSKNIETYIINKNKLYSLTPHDGDKIEVFNNLELKEKPYIYVSGKVIPKATKYKYFDGMTLLELFKVVKFRSELIVKDDIKNDIVEPKVIEKREALMVDKSKIKIIRNNADKKRVFLVSLKDTFKLEPYDEVEFFNYFDTHPRIEATIKGAVYNPGTFFIDNDTTLQDLINLAGGITLKGYTKEFELVRYKVVNNERVRDIKKIDFKNAIENNFKIEPFDEVKIFTIPNWYERKTITLKGEVKFPGVYPIKTGERLASVIKRAGGFTKEAFVDGALFTRESIRKNEAKRMKEAMLKIKQQMAFISTNGREVGAMPTDQADVVGTIKLLEQQAQEYKALGRLVVYLEKDLDKFSKSDFNIRLEDQDTLIIPSYNDTVSVYGEVLNPNSFVFSKNLTAFEYIKKAGDITERADEESIYVVLPNGEAKKVEPDSFFASSDFIVPKGATIVVPMKVNRVSNILLWKEISQVVYQLAITAASLNTVGVI